MLDPKTIRQNPEKVAEDLRKRGMKLDISRLSELEEKRKSLQTTLQDLQNERNTTSKMIGQAKAQGKNVDDILANVKDIGDRLTTTEKEFNQVQDDLNAILYCIPNIPHESVPEGKSEEDNVEIRKWKEPTSFSFQPKDHVDLGEPLGIDFDTAAKLSGARFVVLKGPLAKLHRALAQFMLDTHTTEHGYTEVNVPQLVMPEILFGTGQLPNMKEDIFEMKGERQLCLIPTSEVPVTNFMNDKIVDEAELPLKFTCHSACFRSEAGSYGKDTRGMLRQHQFEKVEMVQIVHPQTSYEALEEMTKHAETILQKLELPYRVVALCGGDLGFAAAKTYDLEVWLPGQNRYREISSCSNTESFQARRMKARYRDQKTGKVELVHTLNGSGLAVGRTLIAVMENYQDENGNIRIPSILQKYMNGLKTISKEYYKNCHLHYSVQSK